MHAAMPDPHPLMAGLLATMHERHRDMQDLVSDLPPDALAWTPGPRMSTLSGLVRHIMGVWQSTLQVAAGDLPAWRGENGALLDALDDTVTLIACIAAGDAYATRVLPMLTPARLQALWPGDDARTLGMVLVEESDHCAMHYGQMQLTRHLYEHAHPSVVRRYAHWW